MSADLSARRDDSSYSTMPSMYVLFIREHLCESAVRRFGEPKRNGFTAD
jgi:hypothetical protein